MGTTYKELFKLYDLLQSGELRYVQRYLEENELELNSIIPCKGIGVLHLAVGIDPLEKSKECTKLILNYGGDPNLCNDDGITPVHIAAIWGRLDNLKLLIGCGGDPFKHDFDGYSCFDYAAREQQWEVYDYLHNVIDDKEDTLGPECAYTLDLERVLVSADQVVAEYEPVQMQGRTSDRVRQWCENNSLVINKLYPTILGDTLDERLDRSRELDRSRDGDRRNGFDRSREVDRSRGLDRSRDDDRGNNGLDKNRNGFDKSRDGLDRSKDGFDSSSFDKNRNGFEKRCDRSEDRFDRETFDESREKSDRCIETSRIDRNITLDDTFRTCTSRKEVEISGVRRLELTDTSNNSKRGFSVYENFSLPGSPTCITHKNYNSKSSLKSKSDDLISELKAKLSLRDSIMTEDSQDLDNALIVAENRTNEWLSLSDEQVVSNTRRSSASSGVSSYSGSIVLANIEEEYKYEDKEEDVVLIEKRVRVSPVILPVDDTPDNSVVSIASSLPPAMDYDNNTLRAELIALGFTPGPILDSTKALYLKKLRALKKNPIVVQEQGKTYSIELQKSLSSDSWMQDLGPLAALEARARASFAEPRAWREGSSRTSFTYLLLDPRRTRALPARAPTQPPLASWTTFVDSIFYVGKGKRSRPYSHLYQALTLWNQKVTRSSDKKVQHILDIWASGVGVVVLHVFQNVLPAEAYTHEAAMIEVLGLQRLKNLKTGNYYGAVASWPLRERKMYGLYLLYRSMNIFISEGERQLRPQDID